MASHIVRQLRDNVKRFVHVTGGLPAYHRVRNKRWLTVLCLHRVLPPTDPRWHDADREWTISVEQLEDCVRFARRHFNVVALDEVLDARRRRKALPPRPILFTFDDGWADNEEYALPVLEAARVPGVIFVTSDAIDRKASFWFETLRMARIGGRIDDETWAALWAAAGRSAPAEKSERHLEELITAFSAFTAKRRDEILAPFTSRLEDGKRHMVTVDQLKRLHARGFAVGAHGRTHQPLSKCEDLEDELREPRRRLEEILGKPITTLALPHSRFTPEVIQKAERAGYELVFTGEPELSPTRKIPFTVGRAGIVPTGLVDESGRFPAERLALALFRRRHLGPNGPARTTRP